MRLSAEKKATGNERAEELGKEGAREDTFQAVLCELVQRGGQNQQSHHQLHLRLYPSGERWPDVVLAVQGWCARWKHVEPTLARPHLLVRSGGKRCCETCGRYASDDASKAKLASTECVGHLAVTLGEKARSHRHLLVQTGSFAWCCMCGARAAKFAKKLVDPCSERTQVSGVCAKHTLAVLRLASPKKKVFLDP